jgi:hypothetical protein
MSRAQDKPLADVGSPLHLLSLPYDIRWIIYSHLFPSLRQVYLMASKESVSPMMRPGSLGTDVFLVCRQLQAEASDYLFNNYLFNIIGYKKHCMAHYKPVYELVERYARHGANIEILDNGNLSSTACVSIYAKEGHVEAVLHVRQRGVQRDLKEVEEEAAQMPEIADDRAKYLLGSSTIPTSFATFFVLAVAVIIAMLYSISD